MCSCLSFVVGAEYLGTEACSLLRNLLQKDASKRLGFGPTGSKDVMSHPFFKGIDWKLLESRDVPSPFKPKITSRDSVENFDKIWTDLPPQVSHEALTKLCIWLICIRPSRLLELKSSIITEPILNILPPYAYFLLCRTLLAPPLPKAGLWRATACSRGLPTARHPSWRRQGRCWQRPRSAAWAPSLNECAIR